MVHQPNLDLTDRSSPGRACRSFAFGLLLAMMLGTACTPSNSPTEQATSATKREGTRSGEEPKRATSLRALKLLEANRFDEAWEECQKVLLTSPSDSRAIYVSAQVLMQRSKFEQAIGMVDRIPISDPEYGLQSRRDALNWCLGRSAVRQAENRALEILAKNPDDFETNKLFAALLDLQGRRYESSLIMQKLLRLGNSDITTLVLAIDTVKPIASDAISQQKLEAAPEELRLKGTLAFGTLYEKEPERAQALFEEIIGSGQATPAMWVGLGLALIEQEKWEALADWHSNAPKDQMVQLPEYWRALGLWFQSMDRFEEAAKCFTRSLELDPMNYLAAGPLAQCLSAAGKIEEAQVAEKMFQASQLANRNLNYCRDGHRRPEWMNQLADTLDEHGRKLEAILWRESCEQANDPNPVRVKELEGIRKELLASKRGPELVTGLSRRSTDYPEIDWSLIAGSRGSNIPNPSKGSSTIGGNNAKLAWADVAKELGANVLYRNGDDPNVIGMQTYQSNGAGAGVIDYDRDGWPDLFVLQGGGDPREPDSNEASIL